MAFVRMQTKNAACPQAPSREGPQAAVRLVIAVKLRRRAEFTRVYDHGTRYRGRLMTCFALPNEVGSSRLGIAASQKIGNAVVRNRAKRLVRELFRAETTTTNLTLSLAGK
jgi:ribonuclease P protein component